MRDARLALASPAGQRSRDAFAREDLGIEPIRYTQWETKGSDPGLGELTNLYSKLPSITNKGWDAGAIAAWVLTGVGLPPFAEKMTPQETETWLRDEQAKAAGRTRLLYEDAKSLGLGTPWEEIISLASVGRRLAGTGDVVAEDSVRETLSILLNLRARVLAAKRLGGPEVRRAIEREMVDGELKNSPPSDG